MMQEMRYSFNALAQSAGGGSVPERGFGDWDIYADFNVIDGNEGAALEEARDWARRIMAGDARVTSVSISRFKQPACGGVPWRYDRFVETVEREPDGQGEAADDDRQECGRCGDRVYTLSSRLWCDGCEEEVERQAIAGCEG